MDDGEDIWFEDNLLYQLIYQDVKNLVEVFFLQYKVVMLCIGFMVYLDNFEICLFIQNIWVIYSDFFILFDLLFIYGFVWMQEQVDVVSLVVVISEEFN